MVIAGTAQERFTSACMASSGKDDMANSRWLFLKSTGEYLSGGMHRVMPPPDAQGNPDFVKYGIDEFPEADPNPDPRRHRHDDAGGGRRAATQAEIDAYDGEEREQRSERALDRRTRALVWTMVGLVNPPATKAKSRNALAKMKTAYKDQPWE